MYFPASIITGRADDQTEILRNLGIQFFWVVALLIIAQVLWKRGLRRHTAVGG